ncbi:MAG: hypothetical protein Q4G70_01850 [Pseudomonadota bacterium]|nr:hypothetical protein [Pseudomonadota bacterium]
MTSPLRGVNDEMMMTVSEARLALHGVMAAQPPSSKRSEIISSPSAARTCMRAGVRHRAS